MSTTVAGRSVPSFIRSTKLVPPAMNRVPSKAPAVTASGTLAART